MMTGVNGKMRSHHENQTISLIAPLLRKRRHYEALQGLLLNGADWQVTLSWPIYIMGFA